MDVPPFGETIMRSSEFEVRVVEDVEALSHEAARAIVGLAMEALQTRDYFSLALSGGSTPKRLYALLAQDPSFREELDWSKIHFFWGDERHVPPDHPESNYRLAYEAMLLKVPVPTANIHRLRAENPDASMVADEYEQELLTFFQPQQGELPRFHCVLLGMGSDGHTASLFPGTSAVHERGRLVIANWVEKFQAHRITMTPPVLNNANSVIFMVSGEEKAETLRQVLQGEEQPDQFPSQLIKPTHGTLLWLVDKPASKLLTLQG
ncbi:MAG: 6-phosphogluconolactonase [Deltaproteobacteria bacterium]|nr:MAG: 6-phosphogluconolactonase [Deltaproteobacteria bacterium]